MRHIPDILTGLRERAPLIHCITNPISINQCANAILALGGRPIMAEHPREVEEITATAGALMLNLGNITDVRMDAMRRAARTAAGTINAAAAMPTIQFRMRGFLFPTVR